MLRRQRNPDQQAQLIDTISFSTTALLRIVDDILDLSKIEDGKLNLLLSNFELAKLVKHLTLSMQPAAKKKNLELLSTLDSNLPLTLSGDPTRLRQIIWNLLSNAIKFTQQGVITVDAQTIGTRGNQINILITVQDSGIGISPEKQTSIFEPFVQVDSSISRLQHGTGLGLAICKRLVNIMGGTLEVESSLGEGTTFRVTLWFEKTTLVAEEKKQQNATQRPALSLLLVEDEPVSQVVVSTLLSDEGYQVAVASDGHEALEKVMQTDFNVILMDLRMPGMDGFETTQKIRSLPDQKAAKTKIVAFTGDVIKKYLNAA
jgi:CheY-like chemotaxis protein/two-component sensor histidine kinase